MQRSGEAVRLKIYLGEDKRREDGPLYRVIVRKARQLHLAGVTVMRGTQGYGRSTRLHTVDVLFSEDLPIIVEVIDSREKIDRFLEVLAGWEEIGLMTCEPVAIPHW